MNKSNRRTTICVVAARSAGHILPALTIAQQQIAGQPESAILFFASQSQLDKTIVGNNPAITYPVLLPFAPFPYKKVRAYPGFLAHLWCSGWMILKHLIKHRPTHIISTGGSIAIPVCILAKLLRIHTDLYVLDIHAGKAIQFLAPLARRIIVCFESTQKRWARTKKCFVQPYPVRFAPDTQHISAAAARLHIGLPGPRFTLLILGGSQGSLFINQVVRDIIRHQPSIASAIQVIHQTGATDTTDWQGWYQAQGIPAIVFAYHADMEYYYAAADLVLCRSGAGTLAEVLFFGKRCITIPLQTQTTAHQIDNARAFAADHPDLFTYVLQPDIERDITLLCSMITAHVQ